MKLKRNNAEKGRKRGGVDIKNGLLGLNDTPPRSLKKGGRGSKIRAYKA
jgi:hypothetical protein